MTDNSFEILTIGRVSVDLYPPEIGLSLSEIKSFDTCDQYTIQGGSTNDVYTADECFAVVVSQQ